MVGSPARAQGAHSKDRGLTVALHPINFTAAPRYEHDHHAVAGLHSPARGQQLSPHHSPGHHQPGHSHHTFTYHDSHHSHHGPTSPTHHTHHDQDAQSHSHRPISPSTYSVHSKSPRFKGHIIEGLTGEQRTIRQRWLLDWIRQLKDRLPPFQINSLQLDSDQDLSDERVQYILSELPQHEVVRFQVMFSRTVGMVDSVASAMDSDFVESHISNALTRFRDHQARYITASIEREAQERADKEQAKPWEYAINAFSRRVEAAIMIQRRWRQFRAKCQEQGYYPSDENPAHWKHWVEFRRKHGWAAEELVDEYGDVVERTDGGKRRPGMKTKVQARYMQPVKKPTVTRSVEQLDLESGDALRDYDRAHRLAEILASRWTRLQDRAEKRAQWRAEAEERRRAGLAAMDDDDDAEESDTDEDDDDKALPLEEREARRKERYLDFISDPEIRKLVQQGVAARAAAAAPSVGPDMSSNFFAMSSAGLRDLRADVNTIQDANSARLNALLQSFHAAHQYKQVLHEAKEAGEIPPAPPTDIHDEVLNLYPDIKQGVLEAYKLDLERALREGVAPAEPPKDAPKSMWALYKDIMANVHRLETGYDTEDVEDSAPRVRQLTQYGQQWLQAMESSSQSRKRLLRTRSQGALGMQNVALYRPEGAPRPAFKPRNSPSEGGKVDAPAGTSSEAGAASDPAAATDTQATGAEAEAEAGSVAGEASSGARAAKRRLSRKFSFRDLCPSHAKQLQPLTPRVAFKLLGSVASNASRRTRPLIVMNTQTLAGFDWSAASKVIEGTEIKAPLVPVHVPDPDANVDVLKLVHSKSLSQASSSILARRRSSVLFLASPEPELLSPSSSTSKPDSPKLVRAASIAIAGLQRRASKIASKLSRLPSQAEIPGSPKDPRSLSNFQDPTAEGQRLMSFLSMAPPFMDQMLMPNMSTPIIPGQHSFAPRFSVLAPAMSMYARPGSPPDGSAQPGFTDNTPLQLHQSYSANAEGPPSAFAPFHQQASLGRGPGSVMLGGTEPSLTMQAPTHATPFGTAMGSSLEEIAEHEHDADDDELPVAAAAAKRATSLAPSGKSGHVAFNVADEKARQSSNGQAPAAARQSAGGQAPAAARQSAGGQAPVAGRKSGGGQVAGATQAGRSNSPPKPGIPKPGIASKIAPMVAMAPFSQPQLQPQPKPQQQQQGAMNATSIALDAFSSLLPQRRNRPERVSMSVLMNKPSSQAAMLWRRAKDAVQKLLKNYPPEVEDTLREAGLTDLGPAQLLERAMTMLRAPKLMQLEDYGQVVEVKCRPLSAGTTKDVNRLAAEAVARQGANTALNAVPLGGGVAQGAAALRPAHKLGDLAMGGLERGAKEIKPISLPLASMELQAGPASLRSKSAFVAKPPDALIKVQPRISLKSVNDEPSGDEEDTVGGELGWRPASPVPVIGWGQVSRTWSQGGLTRDDSPRRRSTVGSTSMRRMQTIGRTSSRHPQYDIAEGGSTLDDQGATSALPVAAAPNAGSASQTSNPSSPRPERTGSALHRQMSAFGSVAFRKLSAARRAAEAQQQQLLAEGANHLSSSSLQRSTLAKPPTLKRFEFSDADDDERPLTLFEQHLADIRGTPPRSILSPRAKSEFGGRTGSGRADSRSGLAKRTSLSSPGAVTTSSVKDHAGPSQASGPAGRASQPAPPAGPRVKTALDEMEEDMPGGQAGGFSFLGSVLADVFMEQQKLARAQELAVSSLNPVFPTRNRHLLDGMGNGPLTPEQAAEARERVLLDHYRRLHGGHPSGSKVLYNVRRMAIEKMTPEQKKDMQQKYNHMFKNSKFSWLNSHLKIGVVPERLEGGSGSGTDAGGSTSGARLDSESGAPVEAGDNSPTEGAASRTTKATQLRRARQAAAAAGGSNGDLTGTDNSMMSASLTSLPSHMSEKLSAKPSLAPAASTKPALEAAHSSSYMTLAGEDTARSLQAHGDVSDHPEAVASRDPSVIQPSPPSLSANPTYSYESRASLDAPTQQGSASSLQPSKSHVTAQAVAPQQQDMLVAAMDSKQAELEACEQQSSWKVANAQDRCRTVPAHQQTAASTLALMNKLKLSPGRNDQPPVFTVQPQDWGWAGTDDAEPDGMPAWMTRLLMRTTIANKLGMTVSTAQRQRFQHAVALQQRAIGPQADMHAAITLGKPQSPGPPFDLTNPLMATLPSGLCRPITVGGATGGADTAVTLGGVVAAPPVPESDLSPSRQRPVPGQVDVVTPFGPRSTPRSPSKTAAQRYASLNCRPGSNASSVRQSLESPKVGLRSRAGDRSQGIHGSAPAGLFTTGSSSSQRPLPNVNAISVPPSRGQLATPAAPFYELVRLKRANPVPLVAKDHPRSNDHDDDDVPLNPRALDKLPGTDHDFPIPSHHKGVLSG